MNMFVIRVNNSLFKILSLQFFNMDEIVVSGISGRLPESNNLEEFWENLINGVDMVTEDDRRWTPG